MFDTVVFEYLLTHVDQSEMIKYNRNTVLIIINKS